jgi:hypothetical protein
MATVIDSYNGSGLSLGAYVDSILNQNHEAGGVPGAPHKNFWRTMSYLEFTTGNVPGVNSRGPNPPYPVLVNGNGAASNFVQALQGIGPLFDNDSGAFGRMPANANPPSKPFFTDEQIAPIVAWIDSKCPNPGGT